MVIDCCRQRAESVLSNLRSWPSARSHTVQNNSLRANAGMPQQSEAVLCLLLHPMAGAARAKQHLSTQVTRASVYR